MLCIHTDNSNKPGIIVDDLGASTSYVKSMIVDTTCLDNSKNYCLNNCVKPKSKDSKMKIIGLLIYQVCAIV
jgi:hypothetical protein